jgi:starch phosphorylase
MADEIPANAASDSLLASLTELALDLRWSWSHATDQVWRRLDPQLWGLTHNPWVVLQTVSRKTIHDAAVDAGFRELVDEMLLQKHKLAGASTWFEEAYPSPPLRQVAYFSMEFMLSEALPIYSGGLGNVAGDQLKAASDLGIPVVGVGLLFQQGYFRQLIDRHGYQHALYPFNDPQQLPIEPLRDPDGEWLRIALHFPEATLWVRTWQAKVGRTRLYLLDTNDAANLPTHRGIAGELYGGGPELRLRQEMVLGMAGWRLLCALGHPPEVCHLNEGHAAFALLERAFSYMQRHDVPFDAALAITRAGNLFTTHTPVEAGFDRFAPELMKVNLGKYAEHELRIDFEDLMALGRKNPGDRSEPFNMAYLAVHGSGAVNGVSQLHGKVSRRILQPLFPRWPEAEVPVGHVTNGIHVPAWDSAEADALWAGKCGEDRWRGTMETCRQMETATDEELWNFRAKARRSLVGYMRRQLARQWAHLGASSKEIAEAEAIFSPHALTIGFARRFATYKRPTLLLHDPERLAAILTDRQCPVQLILAGKAHPQDEAGQETIKRWNDFLARPEIRAHAVFLSDYDMRLTAHLVRGVDLWLNTPRRPWEASGTSGMKVLVNGGLNLSELDGWWVEAYSPEVGWALGDGREHDHDPRWDAHEANALYELLEEEIVPAFYEHDQRGIPVAWVSKMRASMVQLTPRFSSNRAVREYLEKYYFPLAAAFRQRAANRGELGLALSGWAKALARHWAEVRFGAVSTHTEGGCHFFEVQVYLGDLEPDTVQVELYAEPQGEGPAFRQVMTPNRSDAPGGYVMYSAAVPATRPAGEFTPRVIAFSPAASVPLEAVQILWQR